MMRHSAARPIARPFALYLLLPVILIAVLSATRHAPLSSPSPDAAEMAEIVSPVTPLDVMQARHAAARQIVRRLESEVTRTGKGQVTPVDLHVLRGMLQDITQEAR